MSLDSQAKRMAAAGAGRIFMRATLANSVSAAQRPSIGLTYPVATLNAGSENRFNREFDRPFCRDICRTNTDE